MVRPEIHFRLTSPPAEGRQFRRCWGRRRRRAGRRGGPGPPSREFDLTYSYPITTRLGSRGGQTYRELFYPLSSGGSGGGPNAGKSVVGCVYLVNGKVITLTAVGPRVRLDGADVVKFFNSVQFPAKSATPPPPAVQQATFSGGKGSSNGLEPGAERPDRCSRRRAGDFHRPERLAACDD